MEFNSLIALNPLDGRYAIQITPLRTIMSEFGLIYHRLFVEIRWLEFLANWESFTDIQPLSSQAKKHLNYLLEQFDLSAAEQIKAIELTTNHDVKAIEYYLRNQFLHHPELSNLIPFIHFGCTSEDINNIAYALMIKKMQEEVLFPKMEEIILQLREMSQNFNSVVILSRTHGQPASPTTMGKEIANFLVRLEQQLRKWQSLPIMAKFNGAIGNFNAHIAAYPEINWLDLSEKFIDSLQLSPNFFTTQIEPHDFLAELLHNLARFNTILIDLNRDMWGYICLGYFQQQKISDEVGSSTMPHKVNPIDFENSEGNLGLANAFAYHFAEKLPISRWQRDLSDSTVLRNLGTIAGYSLLAYQSSLKGLRKLKINNQVIEKDLNDHWEILAEALQTVMRRYGILDAYERVKVLTRGEAITASTLVDFIKNQPLPEIVKQRLVKLTPATYIGLAKALTEEAIKSIRKEKAVIAKD